VFEGRGKDAEEMRTFLIIVFTLSTYPSFASDFSSTETVCGSAERDAERAINTLETATNQVNQNIDERIRNTHAVLLRMERSRINQLIEEQKRSGKYDMSYERLASNVIDVKSQNYRFALCERKRRPGASKMTIATDTYSRCRDILLRQKSETYGLCF